MRSGITGIITTRSPMLPTMFSPRVFRKRPRDSFRELMTPFSSKIITGMTKKVRRLPATPRIPEAWEPAHLCGS